MTTFLTNLASRALGPSSMNASRLLRPIVPSIFASTAVESNMDATMDFQQGAMHSVKNSQPSQATAHAFDPAQIRFEVEEQEQDRVLDPARTHILAAEARLGRQGARRDSNLSAEDPARMSLLPESKIAIGQNFPDNAGVSSKDKFTSSAKGTDRPVLPQSAAKMAVDRDWEDDARPSAYRSMATVIPDRSSLSARRSDLVAQPSISASPSGPVAGRDVATPAPSGFRDSSNAVLRSLRDLSKSDASDLPLSNLRSVSNEQRIGGSSIVSRPLTSTSGLHGEALLEQPPERTTSKSSADSIPSASPSLTDLRDRPTSARIAQNRPSLPGALRSLSNAHQPATSASQNIVEVHIGRVEVRAPSHPSSKASARESSKAPSLDDYLRGRTGRVRA